MNNTPLDSRKLWYTFSYFEILLFSQKLSRYYYSAYERVDGPQIVLKLYFIFHITYINQKLPYLMAN